MTKMLNQVGFYDVFMLYNGIEIYVGTWQGVTPNKACLLAKADLHDIKDEHSYDINKAAFKARKLF
ncbi:hypothetical protein PM10SUCC1_32700 [Propionigenium maris DSM 9537]|uniref:Uncharacterized protein n=1 Tax=Propionigenium maris DSM 9537 TaxID=1123000 RepID=A0A9W6GPT0_9FUSO|nr:hypothetical protein [Propionigenium maris]GLI57756.1 hypothetical protein PM10SUCC1_32700 [Propionigenium maris DSM 9537]